MKRTFGDFLNLPEQDQRDVWEKAADRPDTLPGYVAEAAPVVAEGGLRLFFGEGGTRPPHGEPIRIGLPVGHPARPDAPVAPIGWQR